MHPQVSGPSTAESSPSAIEYTELSDYRLPAGTLTTWTPTCEADAWTDDHRGLSYDHEAHLRDAQPGAWIGSILRIPMRYDAGALSRALRAWFARHEALRTTVHHDAGEWRRRSIAPESVDVLAAEIGTVSAGQATERIERFFASVSPTAWPHCVFASLEPDDDESFVLAFGADHSVMDAYSQLLFFNEIVDLYSKARAGDRDHPWETVDVGSHVDHSAAARDLASALDVEDAVVRRWHDFLTTPEGYRFPRYSAAISAGPSAADGTALQHSVSRWVLDHDETAHLEAHCRSLGTGPQSGVVAALALAVRELAGTPLRCVLPMHTRQDQRHAGAVGWYVGLVPLEVDLDGARDFAEVVGIARTAITSVRSGVTASFARIADILDIADEPRFVVSYVDVRSVPGATRWGGWESRVLRSPEPSRDEVYLWIVQTEAGINVSARCARSDEALAAVETLICAFGDHVRQAGNEAAARASVTAVGA